jgi:hypothetical protein
MTTHHSLIPADLQDLLAFLLHVLGQLNHILLFLSSSATRRIVGYQFEILLVV